MATDSSWRNRIIGHGEVRAADLVAHPQNWRKHPKEQHGRLAKSLGGVGWVQDVIVNQRTGRMLDGHLRAEMARAQGDDTPVPVVYVELTEDEERLVLASLDPIAGMAVTDEDTLAALVRSIDDADLRSVADDIAGALGVATKEGQPAIEDAGAQVDRAEELRQKWNVETGQLWQLGDHRLICGDCTDPATVARVMAGERAALGLHDPPYGISIVGRNGTAGNFPGTSAPRLKAVPIVGDDAPFDPLHLLALADKSILWGGNHYADKLPAGSKWLVWDKKDGAFRESDLGDCELAWTNLGGAARLLHHTWQGMYRKGEGERSERMHPTQKPVDLLTWCIEQSNTGDEAIVIDCYCGSGTTIIACEQLSRRCRAVEISPAYVAVALERWAMSTGKTPELITA